MKPVVIFQPLSKFGMFTFVNSCALCFIMFYSLTEEKTRFWDFWWENKKGETFETMVQRPRDTNNESVSFNIYLQILRKPRKY